MSLVCGNFFEELAMLLNARFVFLRLKSPHYIESFFKKLYLQSKTKIDVLIDKDSSLVAQMQLLDCQEQRWKLPVVSAYIYAVIKLDKIPIKLVVHLPPATLQYWVTQTDWRLLQEEVASEAVATVIELNCEIKLSNQVIPVSLADVELPSDELLNNCIEQDVKEIKWNYIQILLRRFLTAELGEEFFLKLLSKFEQSQTDKVWLQQMLLLKHGEYQINLLHVAVYYFDEKILERLWVLFGINGMFSRTRTMEYMTIFDLLFLRDENQNTSLLSKISKKIPNNFIDLVLEESPMYLYRAAHYSFLQVFMLLLEKTSAQALEKALLEVSTVSGNTLLHVMMALFDREESEKIEKLQKIFTILFQKVSIDLLQEKLFLKNSEGDMPLHMAADTPHFEEVVEMLQQFFSSAVMREAILIWNNQANTSLDIFYGDYPGEKISPKILSVFFNIKKRKGSPNENEELNAKRQKTLEDVEPIEDLIDQNEVRSPRPPNGC
jgi:hypothetical protein